MPAVSRNPVLMLSVCLAVSIAVSHAEPPGTAFTYQGLLKSGGIPVGSPVQMEFRLFDAVTAGAQIGSTISRTVTPESGAFAESLDFGVQAYAANEARWIEITVAGAPLERQRLQPAPYALNTRGINVDAEGRVGIGTRRRTRSGSVLSPHRSRC